MKLQFFGANRQVTGSRHYFESDAGRVFVDYGQFQERPFLDRNWEPCPAPPRQLDAVLLTHAHVDHCGLLPRLVREGFRGPVYATEPSAELLEIVLRDSAKIQKEDVEFKRKRHRKEGRAGPHPLVPLFTERDVDRLMPRVQGVPYGRPIAVRDGLEATFHEAGHILGSSIVELAVRRGGAARRVLFSGDLGQAGKPILRDPAVFDQTDYLVMESTYGDRDHDAEEDVATQIARTITETVARGGNVVVPTFAIERAQELLYHLGRLSEAGRIPRTPVYLDSPMAVEVTRLVDRHVECFDEETRQLIAAGRQPLRFPGLKLSSTTEESKAINHRREPAVILAPSGMCTAGRIKHHLAHNLPRSECTVLFVGYQAAGTLGRQILEGAREVRIHGRMWPVRARVAVVRGFSGHADRAALLRWLGAFRSPPRGVFLTHGEEQSSLALAAHVAEQLHWPVLVPEYGQAVELEG